MNNIKGQNTVQQSISMIVNGSLDSNSLIEKSMPSVKINPVIR